MFCVVSRLASSDNSYHSTKREASVPVRSPPHAASDTAAVSAKNNKTIFESGAILILAAAIVILRLRYLDVLVKNRKVGGGQ